MNNIQQPAFAGNTDRAVELVKAGYRVFPIQPDKKKPYSNEVVAAALDIQAPPAGMGGAKMAVSTVPEAQRLFAAFPGCRIGIATGKGLLALDVDRKNGKDGVATLEAAGRWPLPPTAWQQTPSGGYHMFFRAPSGMPLPNDVDVLGNGLDRRGDGGFVVDYGGPIVPVQELAEAPAWLYVGSAWQGLRQNGGKCALDYSLALRALQSRDPSDFDRGGWLLFSGAFYTATFGLPGAERAEVDWQTWNQSYGAGNDPAANGRTWADFARKGTAGDAGTLARLCADPDAAARLYGLGQAVALPDALQGGGIPWFTGRDLTGPPPMREWLVADMVPLSTVTLLGGDGGTGKSLAALQLAAAVAGGGLWLKRPVKSGAAVYISAEDDRSEVHRRLSDIACGQGSLICAFSNLIIASLAGSDALLATLNRNGRLEETRLYRELESKISSVRPALIVLDTLADLFPGNENDRAQARQFIGMLRHFAIEYGCAVVLLAHPSLSGLASGSGTSGSTAWNNSVRSRLYFSRIKEGDYEANPDARRLSVMKSNYGRTGLEIDVVYRAGVFVAEQIGGGDSAAKSERVFLQLLEMTAAQGRAFTASRVAADFAQMPDAEGVNKQAFKRAMEGLMKSGKIHQSMIRQDGKDRRIIALAQSV